MAPNELIQKFKDIIGQIESYAEGVEINTENRQEMNTEIIQPLHDFLEELQTAKEEMERSTTALTEARSAEGTYLREQEEKFRTMVENANEAILVLQDRERVYYNLRWLTMTGYTRTDHQNIPLFTLVHPEDAEFVGRAYDEVITGQKTETTVVYRITNQSGETKYLKAKAGRIEWEGKPAVLVFVEDITEHKAAEENLRESKEKYQALFENMAQGAFYQAADGTLIDCNPAALEMFGLTRDEFLSRTSLNPTWRVIHEDGSDFPGDQHPSMRALQTGKPVQDVIAGVYNPSRHGFTWMVINAFPMFNPGEEKPYQVFVTLHDITAKKQVEEALEAKLIELDLAQKIANIGNWSFDPATGVPEWSAVVYEIYERDPSLGPPHIDEYKIMYAPDQYQIFIDAIQNATKNGAPYDIELELKLNNKTKWIRAICQPDKKKTPDGHFLRGTIQDITERKLAEEKISKANLLLEETGRMAKIGGWEIDLETMVPYFSTETYRIYGLPPDQPPAVEEGIKFYAPEARPIITAAVNEAIENGTPYDLELPFITAKGRNIWVQAQGKVHYENGKPVRLYGTIQDITARKQAELKLEESEEKLRAIFENSLNAIAVADDLGNYSFTNKAAAEMFGYSEEELLQMNIGQIRTSIPENAAELYRKYLEKGQEIGEFQFIRSDGEHRVAQYHAVHVKEDFNLSILSDITDQKNSAEQLEKYMGRLEIAQEIGNIGTWNLDIVNDTLAWTKQNYEIFGVEVDHQLMELERFFEITHPEDRDFVARKWNAALEGEAYDIEHRILVNGEVKWVREKAIVSFDESGTATHAVGITMDISEQKAAEEIIRKSRNRVQALAQKVISAQEDERKHISREIHDESGQILTVLKIQLDMLRDDLPEETGTLRAQLTDAISLVDNALESLRSMAQGLRPPSLSTLGFGITLENLCLEFGDRVGLPVVFRAAAIPEIDDVIQITLYRFTQEALTNIARHAQASAIEVELRKLDQAIELQIWDDGVGFGPKGSESSGLGLTSMGERLELIGGSLEIQTKPGEGVQLIATVPVED